MFSTSLNGLNTKWLKENETKATTFEVLNGAVLVFSGGIFAASSILAYTKFLRR
jgi:hypothetical protein